MGPASARIATGLRLSDQGSQRQRPVAGFTVAGGEQAQVRSSWQRPLSDEIIGSSLQVWSAPGVQAGITQPRSGRKQAPAGQLQTVIV